MTLFKKKFILLALLIIVYLALTRIKPIGIPKNNSSQKTEISVTVSAKEDNLVRTYQGTLPCDNCDGIETTLMFLGVATIWVFINLLQGIGGH